MIRELGKYDVNEDSQISPEDTTTDNITTLIHTSMTYDIKMEGTLSCPDFKNEREMVDHTIW